MLRRLFLALLFSFYLPVTLAASNVIYITLDGVRWQDVYQTKDYFPKLWGKHAKRLVFYGKPHSNTTMEVASIPISLPSYQSQTTGKIQLCENNQCGRVKEKTLPEYLIEDRHFGKQDVVIFSSWTPIGDAVESKPGTTYCNNGNIPVTDPITHKPDTIMAELNYKQKNHLPELPLDRFDIYTVPQALHYFEKYQPKFMWLSLGDADEDAHANNLQKYYKQLGFYDNALDKLFTTLKAMHKDKDTLVIVTTDHGRGNGKNWNFHGPKYPESKRTFAFVMNGELVPVKKDGNITHYSTLSIRPTIEKALS